MMTTVTGTWGNYRSIDKNGREKTSKKSVIKLNLKEGGKGEMKIFFLHAPIEWERRGDELALINLKDHKAMMVTMVGDELKHVEEDGSESYFRKLS